MEKFVLVYLKFQLLISPKKYFHLVVTLVSCQKGVSMQYSGKKSKVLSVPVTNRVPFWCTSGALCYCFGALLKRVTQVQHSQSYMVLCL